MTSSSDLTIKIWDLEKSKESINIEIENFVSSISFNKNGSCFCFSTKNKMMKICDPRNKSKIINEIQIQDSIKPSNVLWMSTKDRIVTSGFTKISERIIRIWDPRMLKENLDSKIIDSMGSSLSIFQDESFPHIYLIGKQESKMKQFDFENEDLFFHLNDHHLGYGNLNSSICMFPKRLVDVSKCELNRFFVATLKGKGFPFSFIVPRKSSIFQSDIYPDCKDNRAPMIHFDWLNGKDLDPILISLKPELANKENLWIKMKYFKLIRKIKFKNIQFYFKEKF